MKRRSAWGVAVAVFVLGSGALAQEPGRDIINATSPSEGVLFGGQPTEEQLQELADASYKTVIDLRGENEDRGFDEAAATKAAGLEYLKVPMTRETMASKETWDEFVRLFAEAEKPILVHCASGGRVGAAYYAFLVSEEGMSRKEAREKAADFGLRSDRLAVPVDAYLETKGK